MPISISNGQDRGAEDGRSFWTSKTRITHTWLLFADLGLPPLDPAQDRVMICGSPGLLKDACALLNARGFVISPHIGEPGH